MPEERTDEVATMPAKIIHFLMKMIPNFSGPPRREGRPCPRITQRQTRRAATRTDARTDTVQRRLPRFRSEFRRLPPGRPRQQRVAQFSSPWTSYVWLQKGTASSGEGGRKKETNWTESEREKQKTARRMRELFLRRCCHPPSFIIYN